MKNRKNRPHKGSSRPFGPRPESREGKPAFKGKKSGGAGFKAGKRDGDKDGDKKAKRPGSFKSKAQPGEKHDARPHEKPRDKKKFYTPRLERDDRGPRHPAPAMIKKRGVLLFGSHAVTEAWLNPERQFHALYLAEAASAAFQETLDKARQRGLKRPAPTPVEKRQLERLCGQESVHQGIAADAAELPEISIEDIIIREAAKPRSVLLILDQVTDPHNVGAILRSACAFGCGGVVMQRKHAPMLEGVLAKTASGAAEHIPVAYETNLSRSIEALQAADYIVYGLDERGDQDLNQLVRAGVPHKTALVLGAEGPGLRALVKSHCDSLVRLPTSGEIASLNVSNAAAVSLFALTQRG